ncbi:hypothetical protein [Devosia chinhatensis]|uniref:Uncharacterized protein n=1 Tax=Devosia chinhatensis TaxID=429727 RepID=A0A0F5FLS7_9HYPH|nr:hypothetical protein [Devosia chinhatensis]KKB09801.1 hypothetical protein VE26_08080 [Devosia chinhatensis]
MARYEALLRDPKCSRVVIATLSQQPGPQFEILGSPRTAAAGLRPDPSRIDIARLEGVGRNRELEK